MSDEEPEVVADAPLDPFADPAKGAGLPAQDRPHPHPVRREDTPEQRAKRCPFWKGCACDHTDCTDGWLDRWETVTRNGREYDAVKRCPSCHDALVMAGELAGMRGKRHHP